MTDIQKIKEILKTNQPKCFEDFVCAYLNIYYDDFSADRLFDLVERLNVGEVAPREGKEDAK